VRVVVTSAVAGAAGPAGLSVELQPDGDGREVAASGSTLVDDDSGATVADIADVLPGSYKVVVAGSDGRGSYASPDDAPVAIPVDAGHTDEDATRFDTTAVLQEARIAGTVVVDDRNGSPSASTATVTLTQPDGTTQADTIVLTEGRDDRPRGTFSFFAPGAGSYGLSAAVDVPAGVYAPATLDAFEVAVGDNLSSKDLTIGRTSTTSTTEQPAPSSTTTSTAPEEATTTTVAPSSTTSSVVEPPP
jgi:hypothetical protein